MGILTPPQRRAANGKTPSYPASMGTEPEPATRPTASERICAAIGLPPPVPMTPGERAVWEAKLARAERDTAEFWAAVDAEADAA